MVTDTWFGQALTIGVDIGGSKVSAGVVTPQGRVLAHVRTETPHRSKSPGVVEETVVGVVDELRAAHPVRAVGVGAAGFVDEYRATVLFAPHLSWRGEPLRDALSARLGLPVVVENDANAAAWAEARVGSGRDSDDVVVVNLGTGIGGAIVLGGRLHRGRYGLAGEFGHMRVVPGGHLCECGNRGCWEQYVSGHALAREARSLVAAGSPVTRALSEAVGGDPSLVTGVLVGELAAKGDRACMELTEDAGQWLGLGLADLAAAFDPEVFIVGGGVSETGDLLLGPARTAFERGLTGRGHRPAARIVPAALGNEAGIVGAADLAREGLPRWCQGRGQPRLGRG
ncbi:glucokinase [Nocardiopsis kunsanensis]|uniref:Glucokinase n=1 Tax=Nocardiopsis kunsanensis TaxID=141693 RepID=A0A919CGU5_9ACTN|nr:ROK family glucokinase [Nocardiopsis kunsanensis]GHD23722.1 glucokinase [Nocardiopsis kunsanensis]